MFCLFNYLQYMAAGQLWPTVESRPYLQYKVYIDILNMWPFYGIPHNVPYFVSSALISRQPSILIENLLLHLSLVSWNNFLHTLGMFSPLIFYSGMVIICKDDWFPQISDLSVDITYDKEASCHFLSLCASGESWHLTVCYPPSES